MTEFRLNGSTHRLTTDPATPLLWVIRDTLGLRGNHPLQQAWVERNMLQCGYCQSGQIMAAAALLASDPNPDNTRIRQSIAGNLCRWPGDRTDRQSRGGAGYCDRYGDPRGRRARV